MGGFSSVAFSRQKVQEAIFKVSPSHYPHNFAAPLQNFAHVNYLAGYTGYYNFHAFLFAQATPSSLIGVNDRGELVEGQGEVQIEATAIHKGVHDARKDAVCVFHLHAPYTTALGINIFVF